MTILRYDTTRYPFREAVARALGMTPDAELELIHEQLDMKGAYYPVLSRETDQSTGWHRRFYSAWDHPGGLKGIYMAFLANVVGPHHADQAPLLNQRIPTFRVHLPWNRAIGEFHRDVDYAHQAEEVNWWVPVTEARRTATVWVESEPWRGDHQPMELGYGEVLVFSGALLEHGNQINREWMTRVSFDFRVLAESALREDGRRSISIGMPMTIGGYWERLQP